MVVLLNCQSVAVAVRRNYDGMKRLIGPSCGRVAAAAGQPEPISTCSYLVIVPLQTFVGRRVTLTMIFTSRKRKETIFFYLNLFVEKIRGQM